MEHNHETESKRLIIINDRKDLILGSKVWESTDDRSLFHLTQTRKIVNKDIFDDCEFFDLFINHKTDWGAPIPSTFEWVFDKILEILIPANYILIFNVLDLYPGYFDQNKFIEDILKPNNYRYFFLNKEIAGKSYAAIFFELPIDKVTLLEDFSISGVDIDGFVLKRENMKLFQIWQQMGNTDQMFRDLLRNVYFAFGVWFDHNGMFIATDKFDIQEIEKILLDSNLQKALTMIIDQSDSLN